MRKNADYYNNVSINEISFVLSLPFRSVFRECIFIVIYCYDKYDNLQRIVIGFFL